MPKSLTEILAQADSLADRFEDFEPTLDEQKRAVLAAARAVTLRRIEIERELLEIVRQARAANVSWAAIGPVLGTSGEAARQRYGDLTAS